MNKIVLWFDLVVNRAVSLLELEGLRIGETLLKQMGYLLAEFKKLLFPGFLVGVALPILLFVFDIPPFLPILPTGWWWGGIKWIGYVSWVLFWCGFALQKFEGKDPRPGKGDSGEPFLGTTFLCILLLPVGAIVGAIFGVPWWMLAFFFTVQVSTLFVDGYSNLGRDFVLPAVHAGMIIWGFWCLALCEYSQAASVLSNFEYFFMSLVK